MSLTRLIQLVSQYWANQVIELWPSGRLTLKRYYRGQIFNQGPTLQQTHNLFK
jgi:hypothetical protein